MSDNEGSADETCEEVGRQNSNIHWIEDLFPPKFRQPLHELVHSSVNTATVQYCLPEGSAVARNNDDMLVKLAHKISPLDVDAVRNVHQRVWLMTKANKSAEGK